VLITMVSCAVSLATGGGCREGANVLMAFTLFVFGIYSSYFVDYYRRFSYLRMRALAKHEKGTTARHIGGGLGDMLPRRLT